MATAYLMRSQISAVAWRGSRGVSPKFADRMTAELTGDGRRHDSRHDNSRHDNGELT